MNDAQGIKLYVNGMHPFDYDGLICGMIVAMRWARVPSSDILLIEYIARAEYSRSFHILSHAPNGLKICNSIDFRRVDAECYNASIFSYCAGSLGEYGVIDNHLSVD